MDEHQTCIVASVSPADFRGLEARTGKNARWHLIGPDELTAARVKELQPSLVFFPHWRWRIPEEIHQRYECIGFHASDLPYGRGGSPIQNLIARGHKDTVISAFQVTSEMDAGDIYMKRPLSLQGSAAEILARAYSTIREMILEIVAIKPAPKPQVGEPTSFRRRTPEQSEITLDLPNLEALHDHIRMLDAPGYPKAFLRVGQYTLRFHDSHLSDGEISARVTIVED